MAVTITNVRTNSEQTVTPDRIELLTENDLISLQNNTDVFQIMAKANRQRRHNFKAGNFNADYRYYPNIPDHVDQFSNDDFPTDSEINVVNEDPQTTSIVNPDWPLGSANPEDQSNVINESANSSIQFQQIKDSQTDQVPQTEIKYSLRNRKVYSTLVVNNQTMNYNQLSLKNLQAISTRDEYSATRKALRTHAGLCKVQGCPTCNFEVETRGYKYNPTNILYTSLVKDDIHTKRSITKKSVSFAKDTIFRTQSNSAVINLIKLNQAWISSTSLIETNLIS